MRLRRAALPVAVVLSSGACVSAAPAASSPAFSAPVSVPVDSPIELVSRDFDGDGVSDIAAVSFDSSSVSVLLGRGDGGFRRRVLSRTLPEPWDIASADVNTDGRPDLITASTGVRRRALAVLLNQGAGRFGLARVYRQRGGAEAVVTGDVNRDGATDLVATDEYAPLSPTVLLGLGPGRFAPAPASAARRTAEDLDLGDLNGDGEPDLALVDQEALVIRLGNGDGTFAAARSYEAGDSPRAVALADFNHDERLDAVVASESESEDPGSLAVFLGNGDGTFRARSNSAMNGGASAVVIADLNGDGHADLVTTEAVGNDFDEAGDPPAVRTGLGDGVFDPPHRLPGRSNEGGAVGDFNRDGRPDLAFVSAVGAHPERVDAYLNWTGLPAAPCVVHMLTHLRLHTAKRDLRSSGCRLGTVRYRRSRRARRNRVISQRPASGSVLQGASPVDLLVGRGRRR